MSKIYRSGSSIIIEGTDFDLQSINPAQFDWRKSGNNYLVRDGIENQSYDLGVIGDIEDEDGTPYADEAELFALLNDLASAAMASLLENPNFLMQVGLGLVEGVSYMRKFSYIPVINSSTDERDIWEYGSTTWGDTEFDFPTDGTAPIDTISSSSTLDTGEVIVVGLDIDGNEVIQLVTLDGQNKVTLDTPLWRNYRLANNTNSNKTQRNVGFNGQVYCYEDTAIVAGVPTDPTKVKGFIDNGNNSTLMSMYTCPADKTGLFLSVEPRIVKKGNASVIINAYVRDFGKVTRKVDVGALAATGTSTFSVKNSVPVMLNPKSDVWQTADTDTNATGVSVVTYILLFDNEIWKLS